MRAKKLEGEALIGLFPESMQEHLKVINKEMTEMMMETAMTVAETILDASDSEDSSENVEKKADSGKKSAVKKVDIS